jgi:hypothetical protein
MKLFAIFTLALICQQLAQGQETGAARSNGDLVKIAAFAVRHEIEVSQLRTRNDVCVAIDTRLDVDEKDLVSELKANGLLVHQHEWCNRGPRGFRLFVHAPIKRDTDSEYHVEIEVGDLTIKPGEHFATMLKQGTYHVRFEKGAQPEMISYEKTCCPRTK